jgi:putative membrane protein
MKQLALIVGLALVIGVTFYAIDGRTQTAPWMMGPGIGMGPGMMEGRYGMGWIWAIIMFAFWIAVIVGVIFLIRWLAITMRAGGQWARSEDSAFEILKRRYARGEINKEGFEKKKKDLA